QNDHADECDKTEKPADIDGPDMVKMVVDADSCHPSFRDGQSADMAENDRDDAQMEQEAANHQLFFFNKFTGLGRPVKFICPVPVNMAKNENGDADIRENHP